MRLGFGDLHVDEMSDQISGTRKVHPTIIFGTTREFGLILARGTLDQHALDAADHAPITGLRMLFEQRLQASQTRLLLLVRNIVRQRSRGRTGTTAVEKAE